MELLLLKVVVAAATVLALALIAEHVNPRIAGLLSAFPLGAAIMLYFITLENGVAFGAEAAVWATAGLAAALCLALAYDVVVRHARRWHLWLAPPAGVVGFLAGAALLRPWSFGLAAATVIPLLTALAFSRLFHRAADAERRRAGGLRLPVHIGRALFTALMVLLVTGVAAWVGPTWAGLFAAFPVSMFPFLIIMHATYGPLHAHTICRNFNLGIGALVSYMAVAAWCYPRIGLNPGTLAALAAALGYLLGFALLRRRWAAGG